MEAPTIFGFSLLNTSAVFSAPAKPFPEPLIPVRQKKLYSIFAASSFLHSAIMSFALQPLRINFSAASSPVSAPIVILLKPRARRSFSSPMLFEDTSVIRAKQPIESSLCRYCFERLAICFSAPTRNSLVTSGAAVYSSRRSSSISVTGETRKLGTPLQRVQNLHLLCVQPSVTCIRADHAS